MQNFNNIVKTLIQANFIDRIFFLLLQYAPSPEETVGGTRYNAPSPEETVNLVDLFRILR